MKTEFDHQRYRVVWFCDVESQTEYRLATNVNQMSNEEVSDTYRQCWQIEVLWKFLKMHLKLDRLITKNVNGVRLQIYMALIGYLISLGRIPRPLGRSKKSRSIKSIKPPRNNEHGRSSPLSGTQHICTRYSDTPLLAAGFFINTLLTAA